MFLFYKSVGVLKFVASPWNSFQKAIVQKKTGNITMQKVREHASSYVMHEGAIYNLYFTLQYLRVDETYVLWLLDKIFKIILSLVCCCNTFVRLLLGRLGIIRIILLQYIL